LTRFTLLAALCLMVPSSGFAEDGDDMDFLDFEAGEANRKARANERAPAGSTFLDEDEDETLPQWKVSKVHKDTRSEDLDEDEPMLRAHMEDEDEDEDEDLDGDPMEDFTPAARASLMRPLADNYPLALVARVHEQITVELPVLVSQSSEDFQGEDYWLVAVVLVNGTPISEGRHLITQNIISAFGPTTVWFKLAVPVNGPEAEVEVRVSRSPARGGRTEALFQRTILVRK